MQNINLCKRLNCGATLNFFDYALMQLHLFLGSGKLKSKLGTPKKR